MAGPGPKSRKAHADPPLPFRAPRVIRDNKGEPTDRPFCVAGNRLTLLDTGPRRLEALLDLVAGARRSLRMLYYIYADDRAGEAVRAALLAAAARGLAVTLIVDGFGSEKAAHDHFFDCLKTAGVEVCSFEPRWGRRYLLRNHQKLALADGETPRARAIIGGFNVEDDYFGTVADQAWRDLGLLFEGPCAGRITAYFDDLARWTARPGSTIGHLRRLLAHPAENEGRLQWLLGGPSRRLSPWARAVRGAMRTARRIDVIAAYFAPSPTMLRRLDHAGRRGHRVRVVTAGTMDHQRAVDAARFTYAGLLRKGVRVFEYQATKMHTKLFVIDDVVFIGSANFDVRSTFLNMEIMLRVEDAAFAAHCRAYVEGEIANSEEITPAVYRARTTPWRRVKQAMAYAVIAVVDLEVTRTLNWG